METLYRKVAVRDIEKLMEDSLTIKKRGGEYRTALNHVLNISQDLDTDIEKLKADKEELLEAFGKVSIFLKWQSGVDRTNGCIDAHNEIEYLIQKHKQ